VREGAVGIAKLLFKRQLVRRDGSFVVRHPGLRFVLATGLAATLALTGASSVLAQPIGDVEVKARPVSKGYNNLREAMDIEMQRLLRSAIRDLDLDEAIDDKQLSVALVDVTEPSHPRLAMVNGDEMMYAASLPKIAILFGAFQKASEGHLRLDSGMRQQMIDMIRYSSNEAATYVLNKVGRSYLAGLLQSRPYRFYDANLNGGLWVGKAYASGGAYKRDPLHNISHGATAYQVARFYFMMETGRLVSPEYSHQMKEMMGDPGIHHKFVKGLEETHPDARIYRKSGTWREYHADSAIIERAGRRYIAVALAENRKGGEWMKDLIVALDNIVFSQPQPIQAASLN
jgi:beta-lactamase class A